jgi:NAD(P)-dependent dehydrogenase (short-subunit alcohol dehydrogenase family)
VNAVCPGFVQTPMLERLTAGDAQRQAALSARTPVGHLAQPEEIASTAVLLCSDTASYITGHALAIDGGYVAQ